MQESDWAHLPARPLSPDSLTWRYFMAAPYQLTAQFLGVMQNMHPKLGVAVEQYSTVLEEPYQRVWRSLYPISGVVFDGDRAEATAREIVGYHKSIKGVDDHGRRYSALDPDVFYWAHATFFMATLQSTELFFGRLSERDRQRMWEEHIQWYRLYGMSMRVVPRSWAEFQEYWDRMCTEVLEPTKAAVDIFQLFAPSDGRAVPHPQIVILRHMPRKLAALLIPQAAKVGNWWSRGLFSPLIRAKLGLRWGRIDEFAFRASVWVMSVGFRLTPMVIWQYMPRARAARRRLRGVDAVDAPLPQAPEYLWPPEGSDPRIHYCPVRHA